VPNNALIGALRAEATLESGKFVDGAKKLQLASKQTEAQVKSSFNGMATAIKGFGGALTAGLSIGLLAGVAKKALDYAASIGVVAKQLGVTTKELQEFRYAAEQVGIKQAEADKGLEQFNLNLSKAASGVSIGDITTKARPQILGQIADEMIKQGGAAKNAAAGNKIFGEGFSKLIPLLDQGSGGMSQLSQAAERLGIVLSDSQIQHADQTAQKLDDVRVVLSAQIAGVVADNANSILGLAQALGSLTSEIIKFLGSNPQLALGIVGALVGSRLGLPGAIGGGLAGVYLGNKVAKTAADSKMDRNFRRQEFIKAETAYQQSLHAPDAGGRALPGIGTPASTGDAKSIARLKAERDNQAALLRRAVIASHQTSANGNAPLPQFLAPNAPKGGGHRSGRSARGPRDRSDDVDFQFEQEQRRADQDILRAKQDLAHTSEERTTIALQLIELDRQGQAADIDDRVRRAQRDLAEGKITQATLDQVTAQAAVLKEKNDEVARLRAQAVAEELQQRKQDAIFAADDQRREFALDALQSADQLATTQADHRRIQLEILDAEIEQKRLELEHAKQLAIRNGATDEEISVIQAKIDNLGAERAQGASQIERGTRNPLEEWAATVPKTAAEINEALQSIEAQGIDGLADALTGVITGTESLKDAFHQLAASILADLIKMTIKMVIFKALSSAIGGFGGGASGGISAGADGSFSLLGGYAPGFATGGSFSVLGKTGTDRNLLSLNGLPIARVSHGERCSAAVRIAARRLSGARGQWPDRRRAGRVSAVVGGLHARPDAPRQLGRMAGVPVGNAGRDAAVHRPRHRPFLSEELSGWVHRPYARRRRIVRWHGDKLVGKHQQRRR
jgi:lambda family phage tail tape measure protein